MIKNYYYNSQLKKYIIAFANIFTGLNVKSGTDGCGNITTMIVPIRYGSSDRVVAAISSSNTQNKLHTLPIMSCYLTNLDLAPDRMHGVNQTDRRTYLDQGGVFPSDVKSIHRVMPIPYNMEMELALYTSNTDQLYQILEQILILFDYQLQLEFNDAPFDWTKQTMIELIGLSNQENYPIGIDKRIIQWNFQFKLPIWLSPPLEIRNNLIEQIKIRLGNLESLTLDEIDENGNLIPFSEIYAEFDIESDVIIDPPNPPDN